MAGSECLFWAVFRPKMVRNMCKCSGPFEHGLGTIFLCCDRIFLYFDFSSHSGSKFAVTEKHIWPRKLPQNWNFRKLSVPQQEVK